MWTRKTDFEAFKHQYLIDKKDYDDHKKECLGDHEECKVHRRKNDDNLAAIRTMLQDFIDRVTPSIKFVDRGRNLGDTAKDIAIWFGAIAAGLAGIIYIIKTIGV